MHRVEVDLLRKQHAYSDIRLTTNFTNCRNTWVKWKRKKIVQPTSTFVKEPTKWKILSFIATAAENT